MSRLGLSAKHYGRAVWHRINARLRPYHFMIYASARSGSTSLVHILNCYAGIRCINEPFKPGVRGPIDDVQSLRREIAALWARYNGFKHVWNIDGWPFRGHPLVNDYLLTRAAARVVVLHRKNVLQRIVSDTLAHQSNVWHVQSAEDRTRQRDHAFKPLDLDTIRQSVKQEHQALADVKRHLDDADVPYKSFSYEDIFARQTQDQQLSVLGDIISFVTDSPYKPHRLSPDALTILDPAQRRLNSAETYESVPNIHEIEAALGSNETGYLFR